MPATMTDTACQYCGKQFSARVAELKRGGARFCSRVCATTDHRTRISHDCPQCGKEFIGTPTARFCSRRCHSISKKGVARAVPNAECAMCKTPFHVVPSRLKSTQHVCCSRQCEWEYRKSQWQARFWDRVDKSGNCWIWKGPTTKGGYGKTPHNRGVMLCHRLSFIIANGCIPEGMCVLHKCDNPPCVNPEHLWLGTIDDNNKDKAQKGRAPSGSHEYHTYPRGSIHKNAKITEEIAREIRCAYSAREGSQQSIADKFGVHQSAVSSIIRRKTWAHVE